MKPRTSAQGIEHHQRNPVRVYDECTIQCDRTAQARAMVRLALGPKKHALIVELCAGTADICGPFSNEGHFVYAVDCHAAALEKARERFPNLHTSTENVELVGLFPQEEDVVILCETLEHLADPGALVRKWLPHAKASVISHPLDEPTDSPTSGGDHQWSLSEQDFNAAFEAGGHRLIEKKIFQMGSYKIILGYGLRRE